MKMWLYNNLPFNLNDYLQQHPSAIGVVYIVTSGISGTMYIGQKCFHLKKTRPPLQGQTRRRHYKIINPNWDTYYGSNDELNRAVKAFGSQHFSRDILYVCDNKVELNYLETYEIFKNNALVDSRFYNKAHSVRLGGQQLKAINNIRIKFGI